METTTSSSGGNVSNATGPAGWAPAPNLVLASQIMINLVLFFMMIAMGCAMTFSHFKEIMKRPVALTLGAVCQFGVMPTLGFSLAHAFQLPPNMAIGTIIIASCPGGMASNFYTFWLEGDPTLSVCMTTVSTILGIGMMPWCIYLYTQSWVSLSTVLVPSATEIVITLVILLVPVAIGMVMRWKCPKAAIKIGLVVNIIVVICYIIAIAIYVVTFTPVFQSSWRPYLLAFTYPVLAFSIGYAIAWIFKRNKYQCRTIALETGVQNGGLALSLINLLLLKGEGAGPGIGEMIVIPILHTLAVTLEGFSGIGLYWLYKRCVLGEKELESLKDDRNLGRLRDDEPSPKARGKSSTSKVGSVNAACESDVVTTADKASEASFPGEGGEFAYTSSVLTPSK